MVNIDYDGDAVDDSVNALPVVVAASYGAGVIDQALSVGPLFTGAYIEDADILVPLEAIDQTLWFRFKFVGEVSTEAGDFYFDIGAGGGARFNAGIEMTALNSEFRYRLLIETNSGAEELNASIQADNDWHSVLFSWTNATSIMRCVVDDVELFSAEHPSGVDDIIADMELQLPQSPSALTGTVLVDHVCVWNRILSAGEITALMETPTAAVAATAMQQVAAVAACPAAHAAAVTATQRI